MESEDKSKSDFVDVIDDGPGPNMYMLPTLIGQTNHDPRKPQQPAFSLTGRRHSERVPEHPAPNSYQTSYMTRYGHETAGKVDPTLKDRFPEPRVKVMPGPKYDVTKPTKVTRLSQAPEYSLRGRIQHKPPNLQFPGPNQVNLPTYINGTGQTVVGKSSPAYLLASRVTRTEIDMETPGPLEYAATPLDVTKTAAPKTLMSGQTPCTWKIFWALD